MIFFKPTKDNFVFNLNEQAIDFTAGTVRTYTTSCHAVTISHLRFWKTDLIVWDPVFRLRTGILFVHAPVLSLTMDASSTGKTHKNLSALWLLNQRDLAHVWT